MDYSTVSNERDLKMSRHSDVIYTLSFVSEHFEGFFSEHTTRCVLSNILHKCKRLL